MTDQLNLNFDDYDSPSDAIDTLTLVRFLNGREPWSKTVKLNRVRAEASLLPDGVEPELEAIMDDRSSLLARGEFWTLRVVRWHDESAVFTVTAVSRGVGERVLEAVTRDVVAPEPERGQFVRATFSHLGSRGPVRHARDLSVEPWARIRGNYSRRVASSLDALMEVRPETVTGRLLLVHGPPGTGKTTALRSLADAWRDWCELEFVIDPERLLQTPSYLLSSVLGEDEAGDEQRWRLILLEDCDELIRADAKAGSGQSLARLLNLTDGLLGQGLRVLVAITTNEPLQRLHPALTRPGRCLAEIEVGPLSAEEAAARLADTTVKGPMTLAELFARQEEREPIGHRPEQYRTGQYL